MALPVAETWFHVRRVEPEGARPVWRLDEPHVHPLFRANLHFLPGRDLDLVIDSGMGVAPVRPAIEALREDPARPLVHLCTHAHLDHVGGVHEFEERWIHPAEAPDLTAPTPLATLRSAEIPEAFRALFRESGCPPLTPLLIDALPRADYDLDAYRFVGAPPTRLLEEGERLDLGDRVLEVWHLPGHSAGGVGLWDAAEGALFSGDAVHDGPLILADDAADYGRTLRRLREVDARVVHAGHEAAFGAARLRAICDDHLRRWAL
ncbi:MAG: MBL fold metallo-hydrolase [Paracoccaceae bacterium]